MHPRRDGWKISESEALCGYQTPLQLGWPGLLADEFMKLCTSVACTEILTYDFLCCNCESSYILTPIQYREIIFD